MIINGNYILTTEESKRARLIEIMQAQFGVDVDLTDQSFLGSFTKVMARIMQEEDEKQQETFNSFFPVNNEGLLLDRTLYPLIRKTGNRAVGTIEFTAQDNMPLNIPLGSIFTLPNESEYIMLTSVNISATDVGRTEVAQVQSVDVGLDKNIVTGSESETIASISFTGINPDIKEAKIVPNGILGGAGIESDTEFINRWERGLQTSNIVSAEGSLIKELESYPFLDVARLDINNTVREADGIPGNGYLVTVKPVGAFSNFQRQLIAQSIARHIPAWYMSSGGTRIDLPLGTDIITVRYNVASRFIFNLDIRLAVPDEEFNLRVIRNNVETTIPDLDAIERFGRLIRQRLLRHFGGRDDDGRMNYETHPITDARATWSAGETTQRYPGKLDKRLGATLNMFTARGLFYELTNDQAVSNIAWISRFRAVSRITPRYPFDLDTGSGNSGTYDELDQSTYQYTIPNNYFFELINTDIKIEVVHRLIPYYV